MLHPMRKFAAGIAVLSVALLAMLMAAPAHAHDELLSTTPANGARLTQAPDAIVLKFEEAPLKDTTKIVATDSSGKQFALTGVVVTGGTARAPWPTDAGPDSYKVVWRNVGSDGHPLTGSFGFSYTSASGGPTATAAPTGSPDASIGVPTPVPTTSPVTATGPSGLGGTMWLLPTVIGILIILGAIFGLRAARKRKQNDLPNT